MKPKVYKLQPTYQRESGLWVEDLKPETIVLPDSQINFSEVSLVRIPSHQFGGNHKHPRVEMFAALNDGLELIWLDENETKHTISMESSHDIDITFYLVPSQLAHTVHNAGLSDAYMLEFATHPQRNVEIVKIING